MVFISCKKTEIQDGFRKYVIKKGENYSNRKFDTHHSEALNFLVRFDESAMYTTADSTNQGDINKLFGFTDCCCPHHMNSARFGWRWYNKQLQLFAYCYAGGTRDEKAICNIEINKTYNCTINIDSANYEFKVNDFVPVKMKRGCSETSVNSRYLCYPFFGGTERAPHDIHIYIKKNS